MSYLTQVSCIEGYNIRKTPFITGQCHPGYKGEQCQMGKQYWSYLCWVQQSITHGNNHNLRLSLGLTATATTKKKNNTTTATAFLFLSLFIYFTQKEKGYSTLSCD